MPVSLIMDIVLYSIYTSCVLIAVYGMYKAAASPEVRFYHKRKIDDYVQARREKLQKDHEKSKFRQKLNEAGLEKVNINTFQAIRIPIVLISGIYYLLTGLSQSGQLDSKALLVPAVIYLFTEPTFPFSLTSIILKFLKQRREEKQINELFNLFDLLKSELDSMAPGQRVNTYNLMRDVQPLFKNINGAMSDFLHQWKTSPEHAKSVFYNQFGHESAKTVGDLLHRMDHMSRDEARDVMSGEAALFSRIHYENKNRLLSKRRQFYEALFLGIAVMNIMWGVFFLAGIITSTDFMM